MVVEIARRTSGPVHEMANKCNNKGFYFENLPAHQQNQQQQKQLLLHQMVVSTATLVTRSTIAIEAAQPLQKRASKRRNHYMMMRTDQSRGDTHKMCALALTLLGPKLTSLTTTCFQ